MSKSFAGLMGIILVIGCCLPAFSASDEDWPAYVDPPPQPKKAVPAVPPPVKKKGFLRGLFGKKPSSAPAQGQTPAPTILGDDNKPLDVPAKPFPLLRLPRTIQTADGRILEAGIYLGASGGGEGQELGAPPPNEKTRILTLMKRNVPQITITLTRNTETDAYEQPGDELPAVQKIDARAPALVRLEVIPSPNGESVTFIWKEDNQRFTSKPYPVMTDARPELKY